MSTRPVFDDAAAGRSSTAERRRAPAVRSLALLVPGVLALVTLGVFSTALENGFVDWDDSVLFTKNQAFRGLGGPQLRWMFSTILMGHYVPVTWLTHGLDYVLWGMDPAGYHFTNILLHAANAGLFSLVAWRILRAATTFAPSTLGLAAAASALFFAIHPLRAESVAWVTERRDVLSGLFFFLAVLGYLRAREATGAARVRRHAVAACCYLLALLSKSMVMTLPALLVLLEIYPFRRLDGRTWRTREAWRDLVPYAVLGLVGAMLGYWAQAANRFLTSFAQIPSSARPILVAHNLWFYASKTLLPVDLSALYELPETITLREPRFLWPVVGVLAVAVLLGALARRWPAGLAAATAYAVALLPVVGFVHSGHQLTHDRYSYLPCLAWALLAGAAVGALREAHARRAFRPLLGYALAVVVVGWFGTLGYLTWHQVGTWRDTETLWRHAVESSPECSVCELNLGTELFNQNELAVAAGHVERALAARPDRVKGYNTLGLTLARQGQIERALQQFEHILRYRPDDAPPLMNAGVSLMKLGRAAEGIVYLRRAALAAPDDDLVLSNFGIALLETGKTDEAIACFRRGIALKPDAAQPRFGLVQALVARGDLADARHEHAFLRVVDAGAANFVGPALLPGW